MRILPPALRNSPMQKQGPGFMAILALCIGLLATGAKPAYAHHVSTAKVSASCTSYTLQLSAASMAAGKNYTITYKLTYTPTTGAAVVVTGSVPFTASSMGTYSTTLTKPVNLITGTYKLTGTATLVGANTINIAFTPTTLACDCPD